MEHSSQFKTVSRQFAVQSLFNACYSETLHVTARFLKRDLGGCECRPADAVRTLQEQGLLDGHDVEALRKSCMRCRHSLERAAEAWGSGDKVTLRERLAEYRLAAGEVRKELSRLAQ